jgi:3'(2'), 5'-bisphosphate nucleotidase
MPDFYDRQEFRYFFCISPLDGHKEFVRRNGQFSVNIGLCRISYPVLGVIYIPCTTNFCSRQLPRIYYALEGHGAFVRPLQSSDSNPDMKPQRLECQEFFENDENLRLLMSSINAVSPLRAALSADRITPDQFITHYMHPILVSAGGSNLLMKQDSLPATTTSSSDPMVQSHPTITIPSPSYTISSTLTGSTSVIFNILMIVERKIDVYPRFTITCEWNTCAVHAILNEAGGEIVQLPSTSSFQLGLVGEQLDYNKQYPINPLFIAYGKRLIQSSPPTSLPSLLGSGFAEMEDPEIQEKLRRSLQVYDQLNEEDSLEIQRKYQNVLELHEKQEELKRLLSLQRQLSRHVQNRQKVEKKGDEVKSGVVEEETESNSMPEEIEEEIERNRPKTVSLSLGLFGIFLGILGICMGIGYHIQHKNINN